MNMLKREFACRFGVILLLAGLIFMVGMANTAEAREARAIRVLVNDQALAADVQPVLVGERVLVPLRVIAENLGADIGWDGKTGTVTIIRGETNVRLTINANTALKNGATVTLEVPARLVTGHTMVPLRFVGEVLGADVQWSAADRTVHVTAEPLWSFIIVADRGATVEFTDLDAAKMTPVNIDTARTRRDGTIVKENWTGIPLRDILANKGISGYIASTVEGADGYRVTFTQELMDRPETIVAWLRNGEPMAATLNEDGGGPLRMVPKGEPARMYVRNFVKITLRFR